MSFRNPYIPVINAVIFFVIIMIIIGICKPAFLYDHTNNKYRSFGSGSGQTHFTIVIVGIITSLLVYYLCLFRYVPAKIRKPMRYLHRYA